MSRLIAFVLCLFMALVAPSLNAATPSEPAYSTQLRSCFEPNRPTYSIVNQTAWTSTQPVSKFSSYGLAVGTAMNCMRSVCSAGSHNGLCCNTFCSMYGLNGDAHKSCFNVCYNGSN